MIDGTRPRASNHVPFSERVRTEAGETLIEVLLALIVLALASVALITAFETSINATAEHRSLADFDTVLASSISNTITVVQQQYGFVFNSCQPVSAYPSSAAMTATLGLNGYTAAIASFGSQPAVEYSSGGTYATNCTSSNVGNPQLINVVVTDTATGISKSNTVVVDNPAGVQVVSVGGSTADELVFTTQPQGANANSPFATQPVLEVEENGAIVTSDLSPISLTIVTGTGPSGASLSSSCSGEETSGVVTYSGCSINEIGTGYQLYASEPDPKGTGNLTVSSAPFSVYATQLSTPVVTSVVPSATTSGAVNVSFTGAANAPAGQSYSVKVCTDSAMSANCVVQQNFTSGGTVTTASAGSSVWVQVTAIASGTFLASTSPPFGPTVTTGTLTSPSAPNVGYGPTSGSITVVSFTGSSNAPSGETYTATACTNTAMSTGCQSNTNITVGGTISSLTPGTGYYVYITANAATGYLASLPGPISAKQTATSALPTPTGFSTASSPTTVGVISATFTAGAGTPVGTQFTATVCANAPTLPCPTVAGYTSGTAITGLTPGTSYYVTITAVSTTTGVVSSTTAFSSATLATSQYGTPGQPTATTGGTGAPNGSIVVTIPPATVAPATYTVKACTNVGMTNGCHTVTNFTSGSQITGLTSGTAYFVTATAVAQPGYLGSGASTPSTSTKAK